MPELWRKAKNIPMKTASLTNNIQYEENRPTFQVIIDTEAGKELRIVFKEKQFLKTHPTLFSIVV